MPKIPDYIYNQLSENIKEGKCVFFLGAGAAGVSGDDLTMYLVKRLKDRKLQAKSRWGLSKVAQYFEIMFGKDALQKEIKDYIESNAISSQIHELIARLSAVKTIFTTNYDNKLEEQFHNIHRDFIPIVSEEDLKNWDEGKTAVVKLHGSFDRYPPPLVITDDDYVRFLMNSNLLKDTFKHILSTKITIFIGYSLSDYNIKLLLEEVNSVFKGRTLGYLIQREKFGPEESHYWKNKGITLLKVDGTEFLKELEKRIH